METKILFWRAASALYSPGSVLLFVTILLGIVDETMNPIPKRDFHFHQVYYLGTADKTLVLIIEKHFTMWRFCILA